MKTVVTIGVCVRDCEASITEAIVSVLGQDFPREIMELIVVDGCSRDKTLSIIEESLSRNHVKSRVFHENEGLGAARQVVADNANGDYIVWVDGDMSIPSNYVREQVEFMERNPPVGIAKGTPVYTGNNLVSTLESIAFLLDRFRGLKYWIMQTGGGIYRVEAIRRAGGFDRRIIGAMEDADIAGRICSLGWIAAHSRPAFYHRPRQTWKALWQEYSWWGYGTHFLWHKYGKQATGLLFELPPVAFMIGVKRSVYAYRLTHKVVSLLLPVQFIFKKAAWCLGYVNGCLDGYGHALA
jgi:glycosyltransferase involved in cell wall biosynthesis